MQVAAYPSDANGEWPCSFSHLLTSVKADSQMRKDCESFFLALLNPDPEDRLTAAQALEHVLMKQH